MHLVAGAIRGPLGREIGASGQSLRHFVGNPQSRSRDVAAVEDEVVHLAGGHARREVRDGDILAIDLFFRDGGGLSARLELGFRSLHRENRDCGSVGGSRSRDSFGLRRERFFPDVDENAVRAGFRVEDHSRIVRNKHPRPRASFTRLHVLGKDEQLFARGLDDCVDVAGNDHRRGLQRLLVADLHDVNAGDLQRLQVERRFQRLVLAVFGNVGRPLGVRGDEADVERFDAVKRVLLAEVGFGIELVRRERELFEVARGDLKLGDFAGAKHALGHDRQRFRFHERDSLACLRGPGLDRDLAKPLDRGRRIFLLDLEHARDLELGAPGGLGAGELADERLPSRDRLVVFLLDEVGITHLE